MKLGELYRIDDKPNTAPSWRDNSKDIGYHREECKRRLASFCRRYRASKKVERKQMAEWTGLSTSHYGGIERGTWPLTEKVLVALTNGLELTKEQRQELFCLWVETSGVKL